MISGFPRRVPVFVRQPTTRLVGSMSGMHETSVTLKGLGGWWKFVMESVQINSISRKIQCVPGFMRCVQRGNEITGNASFENKTMVPEPIGTRIGSLTPGIVTGRASYV